MKNKRNNPTTDAMKSNATKAEALLKQLANAKRLLILCNIVGTEKSVGELAAAVDLSPSAISQHLAIMRESGLISAEKRGQNVYYRLASMEVQAILSTLYLIFCKD